MNAVYNSPWEIQDKFKIIVDSDTPLIAHRYWIEEWVNILIYILYCG